VHTEVGHRCRGAKVNGSIVPLTYTLVTGERVEILTSKDGAPKRDWLQPGLGYLRTSRARAKVQHWFKAQTRENNVDAGRHLLEREFKRLALTSVDYQRVARKVQHSSVDDMYAAVGSGDLSAAQVMNAAQGLVENRGPQLKLARPGGGVYRGQVRVYGVGNLMTHMAGCCKPLPGDAITGFITQGRGVSIHRSDCARLLRLTAATDPEKVEQDLMTLFPQPKWTLLSHLLISHGRAVCIARRPNCAASAIPPSSTSRTPRSWPPWTW